MHSASVEQLDRDGFCLLRRVFAGDEIETTTGALASALQTATDDQGSIRSQAGIIYAARNLLEIFPIARTIWQRSPLLEVLTRTLGPGFGLVRGLYFDKPPGQSWSLPWHRDLTIAVRRNDLPSTRFRNPTRKAGVAHVEAPRAVLEGMLSLRIHLDAVGEDNGPLKVIAGSHRIETTAADDGARMRTILANRGDVLAMRPLISHSSGNARPEAKCHRRILHLEFAAKGDLPDGFRWQWFQPAETVPIAALGASGPL